MPGVRDGRRRSRYKFWMFGYWAARWVTLNAMLDRQDRHRNPFLDVVRLAKAHARMNAMKDAYRATYKPPIQFILTEPSEVLIDIDKTAERVAKAILSEDAARSGPEPQGVLTTEQARLSRRRARASRRTEAPR